MEMEMFLHMKPVGMSNIGHVSKTMRNLTYTVLDSWVYHWTFTCVSVLDSGRVKHYKLKKTDNGHYFVSRTRSFETLKELVEYYSKQADGLCVRLGEPCKKVKHTVQCNMSWTHPVYPSLSCSNHDDLLSSV